MSSKLRQIVLALILLISSAEVNAQCAMCRAALASSDGTIKAQAVNDGIVYLMIFPYLLVGLVGFCDLQDAQKDERQKDGSLTLIKVKSHSKLWLFYAQN